MNTKQNDLQELFARLSGAMGEFQHRITQATTQANKQIQSTVIQPLEAVNETMQKQMQSVFQQVQVAAQPFKDILEQENPHLNAYFALLRIIREAKDDPEIKGSSEIHNVVCRLIDFLESANLSEYKDIGSIMSPIGKEAVSREKKKGAASTNEKFRKAELFCITEAEKIWASDSTIRMTGMAEKLETLLIEKKMTAPTLEIIKGYLNKAEKEGELTIPQAAKKPGAPKKSP